jgi:Carboxypeptidase regulatory-like domain
MRQRQLLKGFSQCAIAALAVLLFASIAAFGQSDTGSITGTVRDQNGAIVPGVSLTAKNQRTGEERSTTSNTDGTFSIPALKASTYTVTATTVGLSASVKDVAVNVGRETSLNIGMKLGELTASVNVVAGEEVAVTTNSAAMGANVNPREVEGLPLNGRQLSQLYLQAPGATNGGSGTFGDIRFNGRATEQNVIRYDGVEGTAIIDANPGNLNGEVPSPFRLQSSLENVQEFRVESSNYPAEFGTGTGGQISVITKSGGNKFHGSVFEYLRNDAVDAPNFFDNIVGKKSPLRLNQFGGSVGGPVVGKKTFFFFSYEGYRLRAGINTIEAVPGDQSRICAPAPNGVPCVEASGVASRTLLLLPAFRDPKATIISTGTGTNLFDVAQLQANATVNESAYAFRLDHRFNGKQSMYFRFFRDNGNNLQPEGVSGRRVNFVDNPQNGVVALQSVLKPTLLNEIKFGYNAGFTRTNGIARSVPGVDLSKAAINISGNTANFSLPGQGSSAGTSNPGGLIRANSATNGRGQPYTVYSLSVIDNLSWSKGNHNYKFGVEVRPNRLYTDRLGGTTFVFNSLTDFLANRAASIQFLGDESDPSVFNNGFTGQRLAKSTYYIGYGQDEWKIRPNVTLNYGLRYEYYTPLEEAHNAQVFFDTTNGVIKPSTPDNNPLKGNKKNFGPRVGLTWSPMPNRGGFLGGGRTVLRGGFGIFYGVGQVEDQIQPTESDRISSTISNSAFDPNIAAFAQTVRANFINNPSNRVFQPRAYASEYAIPEKIYSYTVSLQQEFPYHFVGTVAYVGSQGRNLFLRGLSNTLRGGNATIVNGSALPANAGVVSRTDSTTGRVIGVTSIRVFDIINNAALCGASASNPICKPFAEIDTKTSGGHDTFNALELTLTRRFNTGLTLNSQYTFSRSFGNTSGSNEARTAAQPFGGPARPSGDTNNYNADLGYNSFDVRHTFNTSAVFDLPFGKGKRLDFGGIGNAIFGNWELGTIFNARSGLPIDVTITRPEVVAVCAAAAGCLINDTPTTTITVPQGFTTQLPSVSNSQALPVGFTAVVNSPGGGASRQTRRPDLLAGVSPYLNNDRNTLNPAAFAIPAAGSFGNLPRNALKGPNFKQFDLIFNKRIRFSESKNIEFRTEIFNVFNRPNFANPASTINVGLPTMTFNATANAFVLGSGLQPGQAFTQGAAGSTFGLLRQTVERTVGLGTSRQIQFALRLNF